MDRYLITQSLLSSWGYLFDCWEGSEEDAMASFLQSLNREKSEPTQAMLDGTAFENLPADWVCPLCGVGKEDFSPAK